MIQDKNYRKISKDIPGKARQLLGLGLSQRQVAAKLKISPYVVHLAKSGFYETNLPLKKFIENESNKTGFFNYKKYKNWLV